MEGPLRRKSTTGLSHEQLQVLTSRVEETIGVWQAPKGRERALDLAAAVTMTLALCRQNLSQAVAADFWNVSQPTVSRVFASLREIVTAAASVDVPSLDDLPGSERVLLDASLLPTGNRAGHKELYSGKRHKSGMNVHVVGDRWGRLICVSDPVPGSMHDSRSFFEVAVDRLLDGRITAADLGYQGCGQDIPHRKPPGKSLTDLAKCENRAHAVVRAAIERTIALLKQWKILGTGYRGPLSRFPNVIRMVVALEMFRTYEKAF
jgi:predicted XRE-type DNA-binding protein